MTGPRDPDHDPRFVNEEAEELVRGLESVRNDLSSLAAFYRGAERLRSEAPDDETKARHLAAIADEIARQRVLTSSAPAPLRARSRGVVRSRWFKVASIGLAAVLATGGLAAAQTLPAPAQNAIAAVAHAIGIDIPRADEDRRSSDRPSELDPNGDADGDGIPNGEDPNTPPKDGRDHDGDGIPDDNGERRGEDKTKDGLDRDGDGTPDDNGERARPTNPSEERERPNTPKPVEERGPAPRTPKPAKTDKPAPETDRGADRGAGEGAAEDGDTGKPDNG